VLLLTFTVEKGENKSIPFFIRWEDDINDVGRPTRRDIQCGIIRKKNDICTIIQFFRELSHIFTLYSYFFY